MCQLPDADELPEHPTPPNLSSRPDPGNSRGESRDGTEGIILIHPDSRQAEPGEG